MNVRFNMRIFALMLVVLFSMTTAPATAQTQPSPIPYYQVPDFPLPQNVSLCGERFPLENRDVFERLDLEFTIAVHGHAQVSLWLKRGARYFPHIDQELAKAGLPGDLKYLAVAESDLRPHVYSPAQALGTWQFIPSTGKRFGLTQNRHFDERLDFEESTDAAISYLKKLYNEFGSWLLAMAAYNCGEGCVRRAMSEQGAPDYFHLNLPRETERYVYRIAAIKLILENPQKYGYHVAPQNRYQPLNLDVIQVRLSRPVHFRDAAQAIGTYYKVLKELNPEIKGSYLPEGQYEFNVPAGMGPKLTRFLKKVPAAKAAPSASGDSVYVVKRGDTLLAISRRTGVSVNTIKSLNNIKGSKIQVGQKLKLK
jgi:LysM repeat protein